MLIPEIKELGVGMEGTHIVIIYTGWQYDCVTADFGLWADHDLYTGVSAVFDRVSVHLSGERQNQSRRGR